ncbi:MAG: hypothetical protein ACTSRU_08790 [Candidatus Hodarchaeales archaeon]
MPSSVTIPEELRRKIKKLAAYFDSSQAEIIDKAITEFEHRHIPKEDFKNPEIIVHLNKISKEVHSKDPDRKRRFKKLNTPGVAIEAMTPATWGRSVDD